MNNNDNFPISSKDINMVTIKSSKDIFFDKNQDGSRYVGNIGVGLHAVEYKFISLYYKLIKENILNNSIIKSTLKNIKLIDIDNLSKYICSSRDIHNLLSNRKDNEALNYYDFNKTVYNEVHYLLYDKRYKKGSRFIDYLDMESLYTFIDIVYKECCKATDQYIEQTTLVGSDMITEDFVRFDVYNFDTNEFLYSYDELEKINI